MCLRVCLGGWGDDSVVGGCKWWGGGCEVPSLRVKRRGITLAGGTSIIDQR